MTPVRVAQRWHAACLARIEHDIERGRLVAAVDRAAELVEIAGR